MDLISSYIGKKSAVKIGERNINVVVAPRGVSPSESKAFWRRFTYPVKALLALLATMGASARLRMKAATS